MFSRLGLSINPLPLPLSTICLNCNVSRHFVNFCRRFPDERTGFNCYVMSPGLFHPLAIDINILKRERIYRIFSIKHPRRLFQTWPGGPGGCLNQQFIWARKFLRKGFYSFYLTSCILPFHLKFIIPQINV